MNGIVCLEMNFEIVYESILRPMPRGNAVDLTSPRQKPGSRKPHKIWIPAFAGMTLAA
jgi:hypothetical protein